MPSPKPATPPVNVWNVRRENLTARAVDVDEHDWPQVGQSRPPQTVVFGSIDTCNPASTPSSPPPRVDTLERPFSPFSIGVGSHDRVPARVRSRTRDKSKPQSGKKWTFGTTDEPAQDPDLQVKNYGYGFGDPNRPDYAPAVSRAEQIARQREWDMARAREREMLQQQNDAALEDAQHANGRPPRRGTASNGRGYGDRGYRRGGSNGRGQANGFNPRGRGYRSSARPPPFTLTPPPPPFQPPLQPPDPYYPYSPYEQYPAPPAVPPPHQLAPPMPVPLTTLSFPLDATRWHLLGQLEYYLSPQNMAQDFFLRQQVRWPICYSISVLMFPDGLPWLDSDLSPCFFQPRETTYTRPTTGPGGSFIIFACSSSPTHGADGWLGGICPSRCGSKHDGRRHITCGTYVWSRLWDV